MLRDSFFCQCEYTEGTYAIIASSENVPDSQSCAYRRKYYHLFTQKVLNAHIRKKYTLLNIIFVKYLEPWKELTRFAWSKPLQKC